MTKMELRRNKQAAWDDVEGEVSRHNMAGPNVESTTASASPEERPMVGERSKRREYSQQCGHNVMYAHM